MFRKYILQFCIILFIFFHSAAEASEQTLKNWRIIALGSPAVEILISLGMEQNIIARASWDNWPPFINELPHVGNPENPNLELILSLKPDVILMDRHFDVLEEKIKKFSIPTLIIDAYNSQDIIPAVKQVANYFGKEKEGKNLIQDLFLLQQMIEERIELIPEQHRKKGIIISGIMVLFSYSQKSGSFVLENIGAINAVADYTQPYPIISREWMIKEKPQFIVMLTNLEGKTIQQGEKIYWNTIKELREKNILYYDGKQKNNCILFELPLTFGFRSFIGCLYLAKAIYPEYFSDIDPDKLHRDFLQKYFHSDYTGKYIYP